jgi:cyclic pyranopterin phosphate synthase
MARLANLLLAIGSDQSLTPPHKCGSPTVQKKTQDSPKLADSGLTHVDKQGKAHMVDVGSKPVTQRVAVAAAICSMNVATADAIRDNSIRKGDVLQVARIAAIGAAKRTDELIPLCHNIALDSVAVDFDWVDDTQLEITAKVKSTGRTGVEMEALTAASVAALTVYDMCKAMDREMRIEAIQLQAKSGGERGDFQRT